MRGGRLLSAPFLIGVGLLVVLPGAIATYLAFTEFTGITAPRFNGLDNFRRLIEDGPFWRSVGNSLVYIALSVPIRVAAAFGLALLLVKRSRGTGVVRSAVYLPTVVPDVAYALLWFWLLNPLFGPIAALWNSIGAGSPGFFTDPWATRLGIALMGAFQVGEGFVVALAARRAIPNSIYEAAAVEGARPWYVMTRVTLPLMAPVLALLALRDVVVSLHANFVPALMITDGGPRYATTYVGTYVYRTAFRYLRLGYASTIAFTLFVLTAIAIFVQYKLAKRWRWI